MAGYFLPAQNVVSKMQYLKPVLSVSDSVLRLKNKGLVIASDVEAERFLRAVGYFRFRGYALPFMEDAPAGFPHGNRRFKPGATFDQIRRLYEFDRALRSLVNPARFYSRATVIRIMTNAIDSNQDFRDGLRYLFYSTPAVNPVVMGFPVNWDIDSLWI